MRTAISPRLGCAAHPLASRLAVGALSAGDGREIVEEARDLGGGRVQPRELRQRQRGSFITSVPNKVVDATKLFSYFGSAASSSSTGAGNGATPSLDCRGLRRSYAVHFSHASFGRSGKALTNRPAVMNETLSTTRATCRKREAREAARPCNISAAPGLAVSDRLPGTV